MKPKVSNHAKHLKHRSKANYGATTTGQESQDIIINAYLEKLEKRHSNKMQGENPRLAKADRKTKR